MAGKTQKKSSAKKAPARKTAARKTSAKRTTSKKAVKPAKRAAKATKTTQRIEPNKEIQMAAKKAQAQFDNIAQDAAEIGKEQMDAISKSGSIFAKGIEEIMKTYIAFAQESAEKNSEAVKNLMACKTLDEFTDAQNKLAQASFDDFMSGATKLSEMSVKVATDCFEPINDQVNKGIKKATDNIAA